jgi:hypothetical protein
MFRVFMPNIALLLVCVCISHWESLRTGRSNFSMFKAACSSCS